MTGFTTVLATIYIDIVFFCLFDCVMTIVKEAQIYSVIGIWQEYTILCMHFMLASALSIRIYIIVLVTCHRSAVTSFFPENYGDGINRLSVLTIIESRQ